MTCIVGIADQGKVYIGGDSAGVDGRGAITVRADQKVFRNGDFVMGFTSSFRMGQLLAYALSPPRRHQDEDVYAYMVTGFIDAVRQCLKNGGFASKDSEVESGGAFLVGYAGRLFSIGSDYQVGENACGFDAVGCGDMIALGAMQATIGRPPRERVETALTCASDFSASVCGPMHIEEL